MSVAGRCGALLWPVSRALGCAVQVVSFIHDSISPPPADDVDDDEDEPEAAVPRWAVQDVRSDACMACMRSTLSTTCMHYSV